VQRNVALHKHLPTTARHRQRGSNDNNQSGKLENVWHLISAL
jgi:hypothetical protein